MDLAHRIAAAFWRRLGGRLRGVVLRWRNDTFLVGVSGVVRDPDGRILVLEHRYWDGNPYGLPSGHVHSGEPWDEALAREVLEETGLVVDDARVVGAGPGLPGRVEVVVTATVTAGATPRADRTEVLTARFVTLEEAATLLRPSHVEMVTRAVPS